MNRQKNHYKTYFRVVFVYDISNYRCEGKNFDKLEHSPILKRTMSGRDLPNTEK